MIERVIENWLTNVNERQYQLPFCQLLSADGETVVYISSHGPFEQGKDVISIGQDGAPRAYQLKSGSINLAQWRKIRGEIVELVEYEIEHPSVKSRGRKHIPFLVTNGQIHDPVIAAIRSENQAWARRGFPRLRLITKGELLSRFTRVHGSYLPKEPPDFRGFLELFLQRGDEPLQKDAFSVFLEKVLPIHGGRKNETNHNLQRAIASTVVLASYLMRPRESAKNHWALFEGWILVGAYILAIATRFKLAEKWWASSFELCELAATRALEGLCEECEERGKANQPSAMIEGNWLTDGHFYFERITIVVGTLSAWDLYLRLRTVACPKKDFVRRFVEKNAPRVRLWGESAVPYLLMTALELETFGLSDRGEGLVAQLIGIIAKQNSRRNGLGIPNPYWPVEQCLRFVHGLDSGPQENFLGFSYTLEALIDFLARRLRRQALSLLWEDVTGVTFASLSPSKDWEWFLWKSKKGSLDNRLPARPQSWKKLIEGAETLDTSDVPALLKRNPSFLVLFLLVFPHRLRRDSLKVVEDALASST